MLSDISPFMNILSESPVDTRARMMYSLCVNTFTCVSKNGFIFLIEGWSPKKKIKKS